MSISMCICVTKTSSNDLRSSVISYRTNSVSLSSQSEEWSMRRFKPLFRYAGGKAKLLKIYAPFFQDLRPQHCVDYFGGSGTISLWFHQLYPDAQLYLNELDPAIYGLFKCIKENYEEFKDWLDSIDSVSSRRKEFGDKKACYYRFRDQEYNPTQYFPYEKISQEERF